MSRRRRPAEGSLDLLLDIVCNTFGGILFLAMLISVILRTTSAVPPTPNDPRPRGEQAALERAVEEAERDLSALNLAWRQSETLSETLLDPGQAALWREWRQAVAARDALADESSELDEQAADERRRLAGAAESEEASAQRRAALQTQLAELRAATERELAERSQELHLPRLRPSVKQEVGLVVRFGRLYVWHRYDLNGERLGLNVDEFVVVEDTPDRLITLPKPYAGLPIGSLGDWQSALTNKLRRFDPRRCHFTLIVYPDSFEVFQPLKSALIERGYEYRLIPMGPGSRVQDRGGSGRLVQ